MNKMRLFIVDDDELSIFLTQTMLELKEAALDINSFVSASKALEALVEGGYKNAPEVILLDLNMPEMDGWEFLEALAALDPRLKESCKVYILSSSVDPADERRAKECPFVADYFQKPIEIEGVKFILGSH